MVMSGFLDNTHDENRVQWLLAEFHFQRYPMVVLVKYPLTERRAFY